MSDPKLISSSFKLSFKLFSLNVLEIGLMLLCFTGLIKKGAISVFSLLFKQK